MTTRILGDRYELGRLLGYGGMAEVLLARDTRLDRDVAIKILRSDLARDHTFQARFRREAQSAASLNHPAIVSVYDTGADNTTEPPTPFIVMEYVEGQTLRDVLRAEEVLEPAHAMRIVAEMCGALDFSHRNGIVHRDVKPGNVMITPAGRVKVMDFGIARAVSDTAATMTATAAVVGTAQYLSPEQARGESVDARSDVYAVGCVLYELLTGAPPFTGDSPVAVAYQHVREIPKMPSAVNPSVPRELDSIVMKALSKNPANRYQSAAAMQDDLDRAIMGEKIHAEPALTEEEATTVIPTMAPAPARAASGFAAAEEEQQPASRTKWYVLAGVLVAVLIASFFVVPSLLGPDEPVPVAVPSIADMTVEEATAALEKAGLEVGTIEEVASSVEQTNKVLSQNPSSGSQVNPGTKVNLTVGAGPNQINVPDVTGQPQEVAQQTIEGAGLMFSAIQQDSGLPAGTVISTSPAAGQPVPEQSTITVFVSTGQIQIVDVVGMMADEATAALNAAGFTNVTTQEQETAESQPGTVVAQDPRTGKLAADSEIVLTVATAPTGATVPDVTGQTYAQAVGTLNAAGFMQITRTDQPAPAGVAPGTVLSQTPPGGTQNVQPGTTIALVVAATETVTPSPSAAPSSAGVSTPPGNGNGNGNGNGGG